MDVTLASEDAKSKLVEVVTLADVGAEDSVGNILSQIIVKIANASSYCFIGVIVF